MIINLNISNIGTIQKFKTNNMKNSLIKCKKRVKEEAKWVKPLKESQKRDKKNKKYKKRKKLILIKNALKNFSHIAVRLQKVGISHK